MNIIGIEVIRRNPGVAIGVVAGEKVELTFGDSLRVNTSLDYRGPAGTATLYGAIGNRGLFGFDEILHNEVSIDLPESLADFTPCERSVDIAIASEISPGTDYDLYVKLSEYPEAGMPEVDDVIDIVGIPPEYELIHYTIYPYAYVYDGDVEVITATFKTDPFTPSAWAAQKFADALESEVKKEGGRVIEVKVYVDKTPLLWTDFRIEVIGTPLGGAVEAAPGIGVAVGIAVWAAILIICLAIIAVIVVATLAFGKWMDRFEHKALSPEIKEPWSRETLIGVIGDFEAKLELTPTPPEELKEKSDEELRDYCDELAEKVVPPVPPVPWVPIAILAGLAVLGVGGAAVAYAMAKPTE